MFPFRHHQKRDALTISKRISLIITGCLLILFFWTMQSQNILGTYGLSPHGFCFLWNTRLVALHVISDSLIGISYVSISLTLTYFVIKMYHDLPFRWIFVAFGGFIITCAMTHFFDVWTLWYATYWLSGTVKLITAALSLSTAALLPAFIPKVQALIESVKASKKRNEGLHLSGERFKRFVNANIIGVVLSDEQGMFEANEAFLTLMGYSQEGMAPHHTSWSLITPSEYEPMGRKALEDLRTRGAITPVEKTFVCKNGTQVPVLIGAALLQEEPLQWVTFVLDLSTQKMLERQLESKNIALREQYLRAEKASRLKSEFLANMSHELRTPLNAIIGFADLLNAGIVVPPLEEQKEYLEDILFSGRHLLQLVNDVLDLSKIQAGKMQFLPEPAEPGLLVSKICEIMRSLLARKRLQMSTEIDPTVTGLVIDQAKFNQVLYNYLSNAIKFTPEQGKISVRIKSASLDTFLLEVQDTGIGIEQKDIERLFIEFEQLDISAAKKYQGTGLGLALTRRLIEAQGGSVGVSSQPGIGSTFFAILPRVSKITHAFLDKSNESPSKTALPNAPSILIIEDDLQDLQQLTRICLEAGYHVETARTGAEALELCRQSTFAIITLDLILPDIDGWEALRTIRAGGPNRETPIMVVTLVMEKSLLASLAVQTVLIKPFQTEEVLQALDQIESRVISRVSVSSSTAVEKRSDQGDQ